LGRGLFFFKRNLKKLNNLQERGKKKIKKGTFYGESAATKGEELRRKT
jgi:hypothetical protein